MKDQRYEKRHPAHGIVQAQGIVSWRRRRRGRCKLKLVRSRGLQEMSGGINSFQKKKKNVELHVWFQVFKCVFRTYFERRLTLRDGDGDGPSQYQVEMRKRYNEFTRFLGGYFRRERKEAVSVVELLKDPEAAGTS